MSYIVFAWLTSLLYSASFLVGKYSAKHKIANPWLYNFVWSLVIVFVSVSVALIQGAGMPHAWGSIVFAGALSAIASVTYTIAMYLLDVSVLGPLYILRTPMSVLLGAVWFGETLQLYQIVLIAIMTLAGIFVSMDERLSIRSFFSKPIAFALVTIGISAIYTASVKNAAQQNPYWTTVLWLNILTQVFFLGTLPLFWKEIQRVKPAEYIHVSFSAILAGLGGITIIPALVGNLSITSAILSLPIGTVFAIVLSFFAPQLLEKHSIKTYAIRLVSAGVMFIAAIQLSR